MDFLVSTLRGNHTSNIQISSEFHHHWSHENKYQTENKYSAIMQSYQDLIFISLCMDRSTNPLKIQDSLIKKLIKLNQLSFNKKMCISKIFISH